jgi:hypothetical protein
MSTLHTTQHAPHKIRRAVGTGVVALGALIAIGVFVLILALTGANRPGSTSPATHAHPATAATPLVQHHGVTPGGAVLDPITGEMHGG